MKRTKLRKNMDEIRRKIMVNNVVGVKGEGRKREVKSGCAKTKLLEKGKDDTR
jgi:hypothetical protein